MMEYESEEDRLNDTRISNDNNGSAASVFDLSKSAALPPILQDIIDNQAVSDPAFYILVTLYVLMIGGSVLGNILVITAVLKSPNMRKVNNILIVNLAISDLLLCTVVSPLTLVEIMYKRWMGPKLQWICQLSAMGPVCITFVSTLTITGIAIDRYKIIVYSATNRSAPRLSAALISLAVIWTLSILLSFPLLFAMNLKVISMPPPVVNIIGEHAIAYCAEEWGDYEKGRLFYSIFSLLVQFILPITLISWAHHAIKKKLQKLPSWTKNPTATPSSGGVQNRKLNNADRRATVVISTRTRGKDEGTTKSPQDSASPDHLGGGRLSQLTADPSSNTKAVLTLHSGDRQNNSQSASINDDAVLQIQSNRLREKIKKQSRTHALLVSIVVVFALSWFPLNILNIILDIHNIFASEEASRICFAVCHLIGMSSAFSNPILYGWFNESFKEEFQNIGRLLLCCSGSIFTCLRRSPETARPPLASGLKVDPAAAPGVAPVKFTSRICRHKQTSLKSLGVVANHPEINLNLNKVDAASNVANVSTNTATAMSKKQKRGLSLHAHARVTITLNRGSVSGDEPVGGVGGEIKETPDEGTRMLNNSNV